MPSKTLDANRVFVVHLRSYGFFHSGRERLVVQVLKRTWDHIPGSTLYGAVAAALLRLDSPLDEDEDLNQPSIDVTQAKGDYFELLRAVQAHQIRFTPLLPATTQFTDGAAYCQQAARLIRRGPVGDDQNQPTPDVRLAQRLLHTTPHAPLSRATEQIHGDQLFALRTHRAHLDYYGFIFGRSEHKDWLMKALRFLPFLPVGGKGKFSLVEGDIIAEQPRQDFEDKLAQWVAQRQGWLHLLTPLVLPRSGIAAPLDFNNAEEVVMTNRQRYRVWRTGLYFDGQDDFVPVGTGAYYGQAEDDALLSAGGAESVAVQAVPEHSRFRLNSDQLREHATRWFIEGTGRVEWRYLGWGQVVIE